MRLPKSALLAICAAVLSVSLLLGAVVWLRFTVGQDVDRQEAIRVAELRRGTLLRLQLDEETGIRGYSVGHQRSFLQPYFDARTQYDRASAGLISALDALGIDATPARSEIALNQRWIATVAEPLLRNSSTASLQLRGKLLVDAYRRENERLRQMLADESHRSDAMITSLLNTIVGAGIPVALLSGGLLVLLALRQRTLEVRIERERVAAQSNKRISDTLQEAFSQSTLPHVEDAQLHGVYTPAGLEAKVGGDWYDAYAISKTRVLFSLGDVSGHGVESAVTMSRVRQTILSIGMAEEDPSAILTRANALLMMQGGAIVTAVCGFIDVDSGSINYASAGHPPLRLARPDARIDVLPSSGPPLGITVDATFDAFTAQATRGALLVAYSDGLVEHSRDWISGEALLDEAIAHTYANKSIDPALSIMQRVFNGRPPADDVVILTITFRDHGEAALAADVSVAARHPVAEPTTAR